MNKPVSYVASSIMKLKLPTKCFSYLLTHFTVLTLDLNIGTIAHTRSNSATPLSRHHRTTQVHNS